MSPRVYRHSMSKISFVFLLGGIIAAGQSLSVGVKGGGFLTEPAGRLDSSRVYVIGPVVEVGLGSHAAIEGNALYSRFGSGISGFRVRGHSVEFPVLGKYYFTRTDAGIRPFAAGGVAFRNIWFDRIGSRVVGSTEPAIGAVAAAGVSFPLWKLKLAPEVRYTRWGGFNSPATNPNQLQVLLGITF